MTPLEFLKEECQNVRRALRETLRYDYGPEHSGEYFAECEGRLSTIESSLPLLAETDLLEIKAYLNQLLLITAFVSQIERSRLGEFSWPFAEELRRISKLLLTEKNLKGDLLHPIIHVVAEGEGYRIFYERQVPIASSCRKILIVAFPRSLKHHVLLHSLFGHELGHTALFTADAGSHLRGEVLQALTTNNPLQSLAAMNAWVHSVAAPASIKNALANFKAKHGQDFTFTHQIRESWLIELICDIFGILLFGPAFFAAHRAFLQPQQPDPYAINMARPTHPSFAVRCKLLLRVMRLEGWDSPLTNNSHGKVHNAENEMLTFLLNDPYDPWADIFDDAIATQAIAGVRKIFAPHAKMGYSPFQAELLIGLANRLSDGLPPIDAGIDADGVPQLTDLDISQTLYAGWVYWIGRKHLNPNVDLDFIRTNRLCDHALLQQRAMGHVLASGGI